MKRLAYLLAIVALAGCVLLVATPVYARKHHAASTAGASISVPSEVAFGSPVTGSYTYPTPLGFSESLWWTVRCLSGGQLALVGWGHASDGTLEPIGTGPTPSWAGPDAECTAILVVWDSLTDNPENDVASAGFVVL